jgi:hypothetical protein
MKSNRWSSAAFVVVIAASALGLMFFRGESSPSSSPVSASHPASDDRPSSTDSSTAGTEPGNTGSVTEPNQASETGRIVVGFPTWLNPDRMDDAVRDAGATPLDHPSIGSVVATLDEAARSDVIAKLQGDPRVEGVQTGQSQLLY